MNLSLELPTAYLADLQPLCNYGFALAQNVLEDEEYAKFYNGLARSGVPVILDNGLHELNVPLSIPELLEAADRIRPSWVIAPDYRKDGKKTFDAWQDMTRIMARQKYVTPVGVCLQAADFSELTKLWMNVRHAPLVCFPYRENRIDWATELIRAYPPATNPWHQMNIHLMGVSSYADLAWWSDFERTYRVPISVDTGKPVKWGIIGERLHFSKSMRGCTVEQKTLHKVKDLTEKQLNTIYWNIAYLKNFL